MKRSASFFVVLCASLCAFTSSASAAATTFTVNDGGDVGDAVDDLVCDSDSGTGGDQCTLRAALDQINASSDTGPFTINFAPSIQDTTIASTGATLSIQPGKPTTIDGCSGVIAPLGPCVAVQSDAAVLTVASPSTITGLKLSSTTTPSSLLAFTATANGSTLTNSWIGLKSDGTVNGVATVGVDVSGDAVTIGGTTAAARNVISGNGTGVRVNGADDTVISGNYFSTDSAGAAATGTSNTTNIGLGDGVGTPERTIIGGTLDAGAQNTAACDGACNLISNASSIGIDLDTASAGPAGSTTVAGNYIGTSLNGAAALPDEGIAVNVGSADDIVIGGATVGDRNIVAADGAAPAYVGITQSGIGDLTVRGNYVGLNQAGTAKLNFVNAGIGVVGDAAHPAIVRDNRVAHANGTGSALYFGGTGAQVTGNIIGIGTGGQDLDGGGTRISGDQNLLSGNIFGNTTTSVQAIYIDGGDGNIIKGNRFGVDANGGEEGPIYGGILIEDTSVGTGSQPANNNVIGGVLPSDANIISNSLHDAIAIPTLGTGNKFISSTGTNNVEQFIDVGGDLPLPGAGRDIDGDGTGNSSNANGGAQAPAITSATTLSAEGTGAANGVVRIFSTGDSIGQPKSISGNLSTVSTDGGGAWNASFGPLLNGTNLTALNELADGSTGELTDAQTVTPDLVGPQTTIDSGPVNAVGFGGRAVFAFSSSEAASTFQCSVDGSAFVGCSSPYTTAVFPSGSHAFFVKAVDFNGNVDPSAATWAFRVATPQPTAPKILSAKIKGKASIRKGAKIRIVVDKASTAAVRLSQNFKRNGKTKTHRKTISLGALKAGANTKRIRLKGFKPGKITTVLTVDAKGLATKQSLTIKAKK